MSDKTSIQVSKGTKDRLDKIGLFSDTYDKIINRLLDEKTLWIKSERRKKKLL